MKDTLSKPAIANRSEGDAITRVQCGDTLAFEFLYKAHIGRVYGVCLRMIRNPAEAEDLAQQAFLQLFRKIGTFCGESDFAAWLHRVTVTVVLMHLRRKGPTESLFENLKRPGSVKEKPGYCFNQDHRPAWNYFSHDNRHGHSAVARNNSDD